MLDLGIDKLALIGAVALVVIGPERLPRVARTVGHLMGKAQRYVADVKAEVNRSIELEELKKMKGQFEDAARNVEHSISSEVGKTTSDLQSSWQQADTSVGYTPPDHASEQGGMSQDLLLPPTPPEYKHPKKNWRLKRGTTPQWYKNRNGVRGKVQSGAARVARHRPPGMI